MSYFGCAAGLAANDRTVTVARAYHFTSGSPQTFSSHPIDHTRPRPKAPNGLEQIPRGILSHRPERHRHAGLPSCALGQETTKNAISPNRPHAITDGTVATPATRYMYEVIHEGAVVQITPVIQ